MLNSILYVNFIIVVFIVFNTFTLQTILFQVQVQSLEPIIYTKSTFTFNSCQNINVVFTIPNTTKFSYVSSPNKNVVFTIISCYKLSLEPRYDESLSWIPCVNLCTNRVFLSEHATTLYTFVSREGEHTTPSDKLSTRFEFFGIISCIVYEFLVKSNRTRPNINFIVITRFFATCMPIHSQNIVVTITVFEAKKSVIPLYSRFCYFTIISSMFLRPYNKSINLYRLLFIKFYTYTYFPTLAIHLNTEHKCSLYTSLTLFIHLKYVVMINSKSLCY